MVHQFFHCVREAPARVDGFARVINGRERFSVAFQILFPPSPFRWSNPVVSWLDAITSSFQFDSGNVPNHVYKRVVWMFQCFGFAREPQKRSSLFQFFLYLFWIFYSATSPLANDAPFNFMTGFNIHDTRLVIVGQDPRQSGPSSGFAFHRAVCPSSEFIFKALQKESRIFSEILGDAKVELTDDRLNEACKTCSMAGWIDQKVLLLNSALSCSQYQNRHMMREWQIFTDFIVQYLSNVRTSIVFILAGGIASRKEGLVDKTKHLVLNVYHPIWNSRNESSRVEQTSLKWSRVLPFFNANLFLHQKFGVHGIIDWNSIGGSVSGGVERLHFMENCFRNLYDKASRLRAEHGCFEKMGSLLLFKNARNYLFVRDAGGMAES